MDAHLFSAPPPASRRRWLTADRLLAFAGVALLVLEVLYVGAAMFVAWRRYGEPLGFDFSSFWAAGRLALDGTPLLAYSENALTHVMNVALPHGYTVGAWFYPPAFLLIVKPLALFPWLVAYALFALGTAGVFLAMLRRLLPIEGAIVWILAFPGFWLNLAQGQNGALTGCIALGALLLLERGRPVLAGICIGLLSIKPQLAVLFPLALVCAGRWRAFASAAVTALVLAAGPMAMFGWQIVPVFLHGVAEANHRVAIGALPWFEMASMFAALRNLGVPIPAAYAIHVLFAGFAAALVGWVWKTARDADLRACALVAGTFLISPYIYNYDAVWLGIPVVLLVRIRLRSGGWLRGERAVLALAFLYPVFGYAFSQGFGPLVFMLLLWVTVRRVRMGVTRTVVSTAELAAPPTFASAIV